MHLIVDEGRIKDGTHLVFVAATDAEADAMRGWLAEDIRRQSASWINDRSRPLVWAADGKRYSATGLVQRLWELCGWTGAPVAVQGPARWRLQSGGPTLLEIAGSIQRETELPPEAGDEE